MMALLVLRTIVRTTKVDCLPTREKERERGKGREREREREGKGEHAAAAVAGGGGRGVTDGRCGSHYGGDSIMIPSSLLGCPYVHWIV